MDAPLDELVRAVRLHPGAVRPTFADLGLGELPELELQPDGWESARVASGDEEGGWQLILFGLSAGETIPLHDHPGMHVLTWIVRGRLEVELWDVAAPGQPQLATPRPTQILTPESPPHVTGPSVGNVHGLTALEDTLFLDLFTPYYDPPRRVCTYYRVVDGQTLVRAVGIPPE